MAALAAKRARTDSWCGLPEAGEESSEWLATANGMGFGFVVQDEGAGAISTVMNAEVELAEGIGVCDDAGVERGCSREAARVTVQRAVLLHGLLVPGCALLLPVVSMRTLAPHLMRTAPRSRARARSRCFRRRPLVL